MRPAFVPARTIVATDGRVLLFSCERFVADICEGECCFICGAAPGTKPFNAEHVIPRWLLRRFGLFDKRITLPDGQQYTYGTYRMPCCTACNALLGDRLETPISQLLTGTFDEIAPRLNAATLRMLFVWLCLIFVKTHMKDRLVPRHRDPRLGQERLADEYFWPEIHHLHCVSRAPFLDANLDVGVVGSMRIYQVEDAMTDEQFDWADMSNEQTIAMRIGELGVVAVLNDAGASDYAVGHHLDRVDGPVSCLQLREIAARLGVANSDLRNRPEFGTNIRLQPDEAVTMWARHDPEPLFNPYDPKKFGSALAFLAQGHLRGLVVGEARDPDAVEAMIRTGDVTFLFDEAGDFRPAVVQLNPEN